MAKKTNNVSGVKAEQSTTRFASSSKVGKAEGLLYGKEFYIWMLAGALLIVLGFVLMAGGHQEPNEWNADEIYSFRRTALAPLVIVAGLVVEIYAIFKK